MTGIPDELRINVCEQVYLATVVNGADLSTKQIEHIVTTVLEAIGLPALLERVEAAEGEVGHLRSEILGLEAGAEVIIAKRDALAAKVADAWDEGKAAAIDGYLGDGEPVNPYRAALTEGEKP